jgi:hypothetical protein
MTTPESISNADSDAICARVADMLDATECANCGKRPSLMFAWDRISKVTIIDEPAVAARMFADAAVEHLKAIGWRMKGDKLVCPQCQTDAKSSGSPTST